MTHESAPAPFDLARAAAAMAEVRAGERRPARTVLAAVAASVVPEAPVAPVSEWPTA